MSVGIDGDLDGLKEFIARQRQKGSPHDSLEQALIAYRKYQAELEQFLQGLDVAIEQADQGQASPLDIDALMERVAERAAEYEANQDG